MFDNKIKLFVSQIPADDQLISCSSRLELLPKRMMLKYL